MALACIMNVLPRSPVFAIQFSFINHLQTFDLTPRGRIDRSLQFRVVKPESDLRNRLGVVSIVGAHSTDFDAKEVSKEGLLIDCRPDEKCAVGGIVALGKFDALHVGHRALAVQAAKMGSPVLLSFSGMAEVLGWEKRLPIVAPCDRKRIMSLWTVVCGGIAPEEYHMEFAKVRSLSPREFVEKLAKELHVKGVVAGANYRFGYKAAGDASDLAQLCSEFGLKVFIVDPVMDKSENSARVSEEIKEKDSREKGQVSSTRVRLALGTGDMKRVAELLGRQHRLVMAVDGCTIEVNTMHAPMSNALNLAPTDGVYRSRICMRMNGSTGAGEEFLRDAEVKIGDAQVDVSLYEGSFDSSLHGQIYVGIDFLDRLSE